MVASTNGDVYTPFPHTIIVEDGPQSSEDGSGLHSPIFGAQFPQPHGDSIRYHHDQLDIHNAAGVLASQFDYKTLHLSVPQGNPHVYDDQLDLHSGTHPHHQSSYAQDYPVHPRNHLGLDLPPHSYHGNRLPPPVVTSGSGGLGYHLPVPHRRYSGDVPRDHAYPSGAAASIPIPSESDQRSIVPKREPEPQPILQATPQPSPQQTPQPNPQQSPQQATQSAQKQPASGPQNPPRRETSNLPGEEDPLSNECQYDAVPKRRGPDKRPGTRQRSCKKRPADGSAPPIPPSKRKKAVVPANEAQGSSQVQRPAADDPTSGTAEDTRGLAQPTLPSPRSELPSTVQSRSLSDSYPTQSDKFRVPSAPVVHYDPKESWNSLLDGYSKTRAQSMDDIVNDLSAVFSTPGHWLPTINFNDFARRLYNSEDPSLSLLSLVFAGLAVATLMKSSEVGFGTAGRNRAVWLRDQAQASLEASWSAQLVDVTLAKAALMLTVYESSAHHHYTAERERKSLMHLDHIIRALSLTFMDSNEPDVSTFTPNTFRLLFPGEVSERGLPEHKAQSPKDSIWALYCRSMLLWCFCTGRLRKNTFASEETSDLALQAWREAQEIEDALDMHTCNLDMALLYMCREFVFK
ncbi:hypothetical protein ID866_3392 [Astraeus odoratus]|nr:hypothetical protein ID866_3392 [Astraeus odoratus]